MVAIVRSLQPEPRARAGSHPIVAVKRSFAARESASDVADEERFHRRHRSKVRRHDISATSRYRSRESAAQAGFVFRTMLVGAARALGTDDGLHLLGRAFPL